MKVTEVVAAIHAHSVYSDGSGTVEEIIHAGQQAGVDVLILTDHNTLEARELGYEGWHDDLLLIVGDEVSSRAGHCIALGTDEHVDHRQPPAGILEDIEALGGLSLIAHPFATYRPLLRRRDHGWGDWATETTATGLELWSYMFDWASTFHYTRFPRYYRDPDACLSGPDPATVAKWDELCRRKRVVAFGGVDAHARKYPLLPFVVFPYQWLFSTIRTHLLIPRPFVRDASTDIATVLDALAQGHCFLARDNLRDAAGARFGSDDGRLLTGDEDVFEGDVDLILTLPSAAEISLLKDGVRIRAEHGTTLTHTADTPGVYRIEATVDGRAWLYTNPIYLRSSPSDTQHL